MHQIVPAKIPIVANPTLPQNHSDKFIRSLTFQLSGAAELRPVGTRRPGTYLNGLLCVLAVPMCDLPSTKKCSPVLPAGS